MEQQVKKFMEYFCKIKMEISRHIVGYDSLVEKILLSFFACGHVLLEGMPGLGKTTMAKCLSRVVDTEFARIQFTPDLMPADIIGTDIITEQEGKAREFQFHRGPVFHNIILADEINRATPKTQSALLEAMQERTVSVSGTTYRLAAPFFVIATQNPVDMKGTYHLPEAQMDRFMFKLSFHFLDEDQLLKVVSSSDPIAQKVNTVINGPQIIAMQKLARRVLAADELKRFAIRLIQRTHPEHPDSPAMVKKYVRYGASPRGIQALLYAGKVRALVHGRYHLSKEDIIDIAAPALRHRIILHYEADLDKIRSDEIIGNIMECVS